MSTYQFKTSLEELKLGYAEFVQSTTRVDEMNRADIVMARLAGASTSTLAELYGYSETSIRSWVRRVDTDGWNMLRTCSRSGRPPKLSGAQISVIDAAVQVAPESYGFCCWDGPNLSEFIHANFEVSFSVRQCQRLLHKLGYVLDRPQLFPALGEEDRWDRVQFIRDFRDIVEDGFAVIAFEDEVHFYTESTVTQQWVKKGSKPKVKAPPTTGKVGYFGFALPENGRLHLVENRTFNSETYIAALRNFVEATPVPEDKELLIVHDRAPWHQKAMRLLKENPEEYADLNKVRFLPLPPRSPDLNPIEQVWRITRRECTHNRVFWSVGDLRERLERYTSQYASGSEKLQSLLSFRTYYGPPKAASAVTSA